MADNARDRILEVAMTEFAARGLERTSVRDISTAAGVNVAAINYYFGSKEKLWDEAFSTLIGRLTSFPRAAASAAPEADRSAGTRMILAGLFDALVADDRPIRMAMWGSTFDPPRLNQAARQLVPMLAYFKQYIGAAARGRDLELDLLAVYSMFSQTFVWRHAHTDLLGVGEEDPAYLDRLRTYLVETSLAILGLD